MNRRSSDSNDTSFLIAEGIENREKEREREYEKRGYRKYRRSTVTVTTPCHGASEASSMTRELTSRIDNALRVWPPRVMTAALAFEARWTRNALRRVAPELADRLDQQS